MYRAADNPALIRVLLDEALESTYFDEKISFGWMKDREDRIEPTYLLGATEVVVEKPPENNAGTDDEYDFSEAVEKWARLGKKDMQTEP